MSVLRFVIMVAACARLMNFSPSKVPALSTPEIRPASFVAATAAWYRNGMAAQSAVVVCAALRSGATVTPAARMVACRLHDGRSTVRASAFPGHRDTPSASIRSNEKPQFLISCRSAPTIRG